MISQLEISLLNKVRQNKVRYNLLSSYSMAEYTKFSNRSMFPKHAQSPATL